MAADATFPLQPQPLTFDPDNPGRTIVRRCRSLTVKGALCRQAALREQDFCIRHIDRGPHTLTRPGQVLVPLLEDHSAIQLTCTRIAHAVLSGSVAPLAANSALSACRIANSSLPRPPRLTNSAEPEPAPLPLTGIALDESNNFIAPREPWLDAAGNLAQYDNFAARFTNQKIDPATAVTERYRNLIFELVQQRANRDTAESAAALAAGLPEPHPGKWYAFKTGHCAFLTAFCHGPLDPEPCDYCLGVEQMPSDHSYYPGDDAVAIVAALRNHLQQQKAKPAPPEQPQQSRHPQQPQQPQQQNNNEPPALNLNAAASSPAARTSAVGNVPRAPHISAVGDVGPTRRVPHVPAVGDMGTRPKARRSSKSQSLNAAADFSHPGEATRSAGAPGSPHQRKHRAQRDTVEERAFRPALASGKIRASAPANTNVDSCMPRVAGARDIKTRRRVPHISAVGDVGHTRRKARRSSANRFSAQSQVVKFVNAATHNIAKDKKLVPAQKHNIPLRKAKPRSLPLLTLDRHRARSFAAER